MFWAQERNFKVFLEMKGEIREQVVHPVSSCLSSEVFPVGGWDYLELIMASNIKLWVNTKLALRTGSPSWKGQEALSPNLLASNEARE